MGAAVFRLEHELALARAHLLAVDATGTRADLREAVAAVRNAKDALRIARKIATAREAGLATDIHVVLKLFRRHRAL